MHNDTPKILKILKTGFEALDDKKAIDIKIFKVAEKSSITDYFIVASGTSEPHLRALRKELEKSLHELNVKELRLDYEFESGWAVIDGFDFMVHLFVSDSRDFYDLENLWKDAEEIDPSSL